jgi:penicillin-binding protein 2
MLGEPSPASMRWSRARGATGLLVAVLVLLVAAFFRLQVMRSSIYALQSEDNRLRAITITAPRGTIYDRNGRIVAENVPGYSISLLPSTADTIASTLERMAPFLDLTPERRERLLELYRRFPNRPLTLVDDATFAQVSAIEERRPEFRRAVIDMLPRRRYPAGAAIAHVIGYVSEISESELSQERFEGYEPGRTVGKAGLERQYEAELGGVPGVRYVEVDAKGSIVSETGPRATVVPEPGGDLTLGLDLELQQLADSTFPAGMRGAVVALDPRTGEVLVLYSHPTYDPNDFIGGIDVELWESLRDDPDHPLLDRVTGASYPPGSTWKLFMAALAMRRGIVTIDSHQPNSCAGAMQYGTRVFRCWRREGHGDLDLSGAIKESCNVYFYQLGLKVGLDPLLEEGARLGFDRPSGIDLPGEVGGSLPDSREWYDKRYGRRGWTESVVMNLSIGQGEVQQSLLTMVTYYTALATDQPPIVPHILRSEVLEERRVDWQLDLPEARRTELRDAMWRAVNEPRGTAYPYRLGRWLMAGKTGTAQNPHGEPHSWFIGFAPYDDPDIVIAAIVEHGHPDNQTSLAVPYAGRIVQAYLDGKYPVPAGSDDGPADGSPVEPVEAAPPPNVAATSRAPE